MHTCQSIFRLFIVFNITSWCSKEKMPRRLRPFWPQDFCFELGICARVCVGGVGEGRSFFCMKLRFVQLCSLYYVCAFIRRQFMHKCSVDDAQCCPQLFPKDRLRLIVSVGCTELIMCCRRRIRCQQRDRGGMVHHLFVFSASTFCCCCCFFGCVYVSASSSNQIDPVCVACASGPTERNELFLLWVPLCET